MKSKNLFHPKKMNFKINQSDLWPALQAVSRSVGIRSQLPVLGNILLQAQGKLKLQATNLEIGVVKSLNVQIVEEGDITVPAKTLLEIVSNLSGNNLEFSSSADQLKISTTSFSSVINGINALEFPAIPLSGKSAITINPQVLTSAIPQISFAAAVDEGRPTLTGILTQIQDKKLELVATDGFRLAHKNIPVEESSNFKSLIPRTTFEEVVRLLLEEEADKVSIAVSEDKNQMIFSFGNTQLSSRLIEGVFPAWEKIIPSSFKTRIVLERNVFLKAVKLASVFAKSEANIVKLVNSQNKLQLLSEAKELGSQQNEIEAQTEGEDLNIAFNVKYLTDALSAVSSSQVILELSGPLSAASLKPMGEEGLEYIIMPVNLS